MSVRIVVIGAGFGAAVHAPNVRMRSDLRLVGLCDGGSGAASAAAAVGETAFQDWRAALARSDVDAVIVAAPPFVQQEIAAAAIERGLHVLIEKPAGLSSGGVAALAQAARARGLIASVNYQFRLEPLVLRMRDALRNARIGELRSIEVQWHTGGRAGSDQRADWRHFATKGGGILFSHLTHVLDLVRWLGAGDIVAVSGDAGTWIATRRNENGAPVVVDAPDHVLCRFSTDRGVLGTASVSNVQPGGGGLRIVALGDRGYAEFNHAPPFRTMDQRLVLRSTACPEYVERGEGIEGDTRATAAANVLSLFVEAVRNGASSADLPMMDDAAAALAAIELLLSRSKRAMIVAGEAG